jgi:hypothetical protein|nr:MAG TPA: hypothetical protein [Caudoviricetes sp.]
MKVNLNKQFKDFKGEELKGESIAYSVAEALFFYGKDKPVSNDDKFKAYCISQKIIKSNGDIEITAEEACLIKEVCGEALTAGGYGQVYDIIENNK